MELYLTISESIETMTFGVQGMSESHPVAARILGLGVVTIDIALLGPDFFIASIHHLALAAIASLQFIFSDAHLSDKILDNLVISFGFGVITPIACLASPFLFLWSSAETLIDPKRCETVFTKIGTALGVA